MHHCNWFVYCLLPLLLSVLSVHAEEDPVDVWNHDERLFHFVTRPDIKAPRWNVKVHHKNLVTPGYWFLAPYHAQKHTEGSGQGWVGPHIYDGDGQLVWSGSGAFDSGNVMDFRISNVRGEDMMTLTDWDEGRGIIVDSTYQIRDAMAFDRDEAVNGHEFNFVENGTRALIINNEWGRATVSMAEKIGWHTPDCKMIGNNILELDTDTWKPTFKWRSYEHIGLDESTFKEQSLRRRCLSPSGWDYVHCNSVDKTDEGDFLLSCRHSDSIYKISGNDGHIIWRLGGTDSDFNVDNVMFSRQHNIRFRGRNETHLFVTFLDNAKGRGSIPPSHEHSRGLRLALDEKNMVATIDTEYEHPHGDGSYAWRRGNFQELPNGHVVMGWSKHALFSEHTRDGRLVMEASLKPKWLGTYRNYKFPFVGHPMDRPAVSSAAYGTKNDSARTQVHVSWNGATEVASWNLYKTTSDGDTMMLLSSANRTGFETQLDFGSYASYVYVEAMANNGTMLEHSGVIKTNPHPNMTVTAAAKEDLWLQAAKEKALDFVQTTVESPLATFILGCICGAAFLTGFWLAVRRGLPSIRRNRRYEPVAVSEQEREFEEALALDEKSKRDLYIFEEELNKLSGESSTSHR